MVCGYCSVPFASPGVDTTASVEAAALHPNRPQRIVRSLKCPGCMEVTMSTAAANVAQLAREMYKQSQAAVSTAAAKA